MASGSDDNQFTTFPKNRRASDPKALDRLAGMDTNGSGSARTAADTATSRGPGWSVLGAAIIPGGPSLFRRRALSVLLLMLGVVAPLAMLGVAVVRRHSITSLVLDTGVLAAVQMVCALFVLTRAVAVVEAVRSRRPGTPARGAAWLGVLLVVGLVAPATWVVMRARDLTGVIEEVFVSSGTNDAPLATASTSSGDDDFTTVLLLGGDEGPGRWALRTDTMILTIIHKPSGRIAMVSLPRNMYNMKFPPMTPLNDAFPKGFKDLANAIYPYVYTHPDVAEFYKRGDLQPEAIALASSISYSLDLTIDDYVLVNMQGFLEIIDALGGVTVDLDKKIPMPGNVPGAKHPYPDSIGPGPVTMDGTVALGFARSRSADSDYGRMGRQRQLLAALAAQTSGTDILTRFPQITDIMGWTVRTSLSTDEFGFLVDRLRDGASITESFGLNPPLVNPGRPDWDAIAAFMRGIKDAVANDYDFPYA